MASAAPSRQIVGPLPYDAPGAGPKAIWAIESETPQTTPRSADDMTGHPDSPRQEARPA